jgi:hypothetical protein
MVPWWYVHPQNNHPNVACTELLPNRRSAVMFYYCDTSTLSCFTTVKLQPCNVLLLCHFVPKTLLRHSGAKWMACSSILKSHKKSETACYSVTLWRIVVLASLWLWHFVPFWSWFLLHFLLLKRDSSMRYLTFESTVAWGYWPLKDCGIRFFAFKAIVSWD